MGSYTFRWAHKSDEVWVTGTFDKWSKSVRLDKNGDIFEKKVDFPTDDKILYKFVADGDWKYDHTAKTETDHEGNVNNVLYPQDLRPGSPSAEAGDTSTAAAGATAVGSTETQPQENAPGAFPETPAAEDKTLSVNPIPATSGLGNPVTLQPGEKVPDPSTLTSNTVDSTVKLDKESYEKSDASAPAEQFSTDAPTTGPQTIAAGIFGLGPQTTNMIPESSMPRGEETPADISKENVGPTMSSVAPQSTTNQLAGQVPLEPRKDAEVLPAEEAKSSDSGYIAKASAGIAALGAGAAAAAFAANEAIKDRTGIDAKSKLPASVQTAIESGAVAPGVPAEVEESQKAAHVSPEAAANPEVVEEKSAVEKELLSEVKPTEATGEPAPEPSTEEKTTDATETAPAAASVPAVVVGSQMAAHASSEAAANPEAVEEKSAVEKELLSEVKPTEASGEHGPTTSAATATTAPAATTEETASPATDAVATAAPTTTADETVPRATTAAPQLSAEGAPQIGHPTGGGLDPIDLNDKTGVDTTAAEPPMSAEPATAAQTEPTVTSGVASGSAPVTSTPSTPNKRNSLAGRFRDTPQSTKTASTTDSKKEKRRSIFGRIKDKLRS